MSEKAKHKFTDGSRLKMILVVFAAVFLVACYPVTKSKGVVKDETGVPVAGAAIKIVGKSAKNVQTKTDLEGKFNFGEIDIISHQEPIEIKLVVEKEGFAGFSRQLNFNSENFDEIILKKIEIPN